MKDQLPLPFVAFEEPPPNRAGAFDVHLIRMRRARRYVLRVRPDGTLRVTIPRGGSRAEGLRFAERHLAWAQRERLRVLARPRRPVEWREGSSILLSGEQTIITRQRTGADDLVRAGSVSVSVPPEQVDLRPALERGLRQRALDELPNRLRALAAAHGLEITRVTIRNQQSRWGSCSRRGAIALNFRLVQMPPEVRDYILIHELMHLRQANHARKFWRLVESACPAFREAERWLKTTGRLLF
jgi:predicted metal-dependent hydrolase